MDLRGRGLGRRDRLEEEGRIRSATEGCWGRLCGGDMVRRGASGYLLSSKCVESQWWQEVARWWAGLRIVARWECE